MKSYEWCDFHLVANKYSPLQTIQYEAMVIYPDKI